MRIKHSASQRGQKIVIIVGGGFAGLKAARKLANKEGVHVILIDQKNHHLFQPLLYQVATAGLDPSDIAVPIRAQFSRARNVEVHLGRVDTVNLQEKYLATRDSDLELEYDYLIVACGATHNYFGHPEWEEFAPGLKIVEQATEIRRRILLAFEKAESELDPEKQRELLTFVVIGGGPTGVELAGAIADIARTVLVKDFKRINAASANVILVEALPKILGSFDSQLGEKAVRDLKSLGVEVRLNSPVEKIDAAGVHFKNDLIKTSNVFWAAGVQAAQMTFVPALDRDRAGRIKVKSDFSIAGFPEAFVLGDMAAFEIEPGKQLPGLAPAAMQAGAYAAHVIRARMAGKEVKPFRYRDKGQMATIGKYRAIMQSGALKLTGFLAWIGWLVVHVFYLVGFKNRVTVILQWTWSYMFSKRGSRLITDREWRLRRISS